MVMNILITGAHGFRQRISEFLIKINVYTIDDKLGQSSKEKL